MLNILEIPIFGPSTNFNRILSIRISSIIPILKASKLELNSASKLSKIDKHGI
jgi:hypothetical protein